MQNALTTIEDVFIWMKDNDSYIWTLYSLDRKTIHSRNENDADPERSKAMLKQAILSRSVYGGTFAIYINGKKGNGGEWSDLTLESQKGVDTRVNGGGIQGVNNAVPFGVGSVNEYIDKEFERRELMRRVQELEGASGQSDKFWQRQIENMTQHPDFNPNTPILAIGGLASRLINIMEIALGVNGSTMTPLVQPGADRPQGSTPVNGAAQQRTEGGVIPHTPEVAEDNTEAEYDGDALAEVCDELSEIYPDKRPEEVLLILKNMVKQDKSIASTVRSMAKF